MSIAEKLTTIAENTPKVYEAGKDAQWNEFWDSYQARGAALYSSYLFAGNGWRDKHFKPKYDIVVSKGGATGMFRQCRITNLKKILQECGVILDTSQATDLSNAFSYSKITYLPKISLKSVTTGTDYIFGSTSTETNLISIDEVEVAETTTIKSNAFNYDSKLEHVIFTGTIAKNGLNLQWSTKLDKESLLSILNCLKDYSQDTSGTDWFVTIGAENIAKLTEEEKLIATNKGWDIR